MIEMSNEKYKEMVSSIGKGSIVSELISWGRKNNVFVKEYCDLDNKEEVKYFIEKLKKDKLWEK